MPTLRREERPSEGWYYKKGGETLGPVSTLELKGLLASGQLQPRQAVWKREPQAFVFVHAETAALKGKDLRSPDGGGP
jgi:hypothetical protein